MVPIARYIDWIATTPLMLYELCHLGGANFSTTLFILGCDLITLCFGLVSAFLDRRYIPSGPSYIRSHPLTSAHIR